MIEVIIRIIRYEMATEFTNYPNYDFANIFIRSILILTDRAAVVLRLVGYWALTPVWKEVVTF